MEEFGHHILFARLAEQLGAEWKDKKPLTLFDFPVMDWLEFGVIKATVDVAELIELDDLVKATYLPLRQVAKDTYAEEKFHVGLGMDIVKTLLDEDPGNRKLIQAVLERLFPLALDFFGAPNSKNNELFVRWGLKQRTNSAMRKEYVQAIEGFVHKFGLSMPPIPSKYAEEIGSS
jgi:ring-1,2-phenylacetyl-CoA epoxidase subunit PaaA